MKIFHTNVLFSAVILISIDLSSQFDCLPNGAPIPGAHRFGAAFRTKLDSDEPSDRERSRSTLSRDHGINLLEFDFERLRFVRLIPFKNPHRQFIIRRYTFPVDKQIRMNGRGRFRPTPLEAQNVLTTTNGDVVAIMKTSTVLNGIYNHDGQRIGINMASGEVFVLTQALVNETPLGTNRVITKNFQIVDHSHAEENETCAE